MRELLSSPSIVASFFLGSSATPDRAVNGSQSGIRATAKVRQTCSRFAADTHGGVLVLSVLTATVIMAIGGGSVDYARKLNAEATIRAKVDASLFNVSKTLAGDAQIDVNAEFENHFRSGEIDVSGVEFETVSATATDEGEVSAVVVANVPTTFLNVLRIRDMAIEVRGTAIYSVGRIELVLALDSTTSMEGTKFEGLKRAANGLVEFLFENADDDGTLKIGVVPFSQYANVGLQYRGAPWLAVDDDSRRVEHRCWNRRDVISRTNCRTETTTCYSDGVPRSCTRTVCDYEYGPTYLHCQDVTLTYQWRGCVGSRDTPLNTVDASYETPVPGIMNAYCASPLLPLSTSEDTIRETIRAMQTSGETYIQSGLVWAWRLLSGREPFSEGAETSDEAIKFIVLMSDGANTRAPSYPAHDSRDTARAVSLMETTCENIKADDVRIITIAFEVMDTATQDLLRACATDGYYEPSGVAELNKAFERIRSNLVRMRLTH